MTGGGIERVLSIASAALTGRTSRGSAIPGATGCPRGGHRQSPGRSRTRCLAALSLWNSCGLRSIAPLWPLRLSPPLARRDASEDESPDASLQRAGAAIGAVARHRRGYGRRLMAPSGHPIHH